MLVSVAGFPSVSSISAYSCGCIVDGFDHLCCSTRSTKATCLSHWTLLVNTLHCFESMLELLRGQHLSFFAFELATSQRDIENVDTLHCFESMLQPLVGSNLHRFESMPQLTYMQTDDGDDEEGKG
mmetsp:Transcript_119940/g.217934  ORF Transcript_119940/g.217934 Transcript_119940/m.217934 type:complete len:126 (+) Transcript_119940:93-470(+)